MSKTAVVTASALLFVFVGFVFWQSNDATPSLPAPRPPAPEVAAPSSRPIDFSPPGSVSSPSPDAPAITATAAPTAPAPTPPPALVAPPSSAAIAAAKQSMHEAMISYDPAQLPVIARHLNDPVPELRKDALRNMLEMGDKAAAPFLRAAAEKAASPKEAVALLNAADFLELPSGLEVLKKMRAKKSAPKTTLPATTLPSGNTTQP